MSTNTLKVELKDNQLDNVIKDLLESIDKRQVSELIHTYYSYIAQQYINDKEYEKLSRLEGLIELHTLLNET